MAINPQYYKKACRWQACLPSGTVNC